MSKLLNINCMGCCLEPNAVITLSLKQVVVLLGAHFTDCQSQQTPERVFYITILSVLQLMFFLLHFFLPLIFLLICFRSLAMYLSWLPGKAHLFTKHISVARQFEVRYMTRGGKKVHCKGIHRRNIKNERE